MLLRVATINVVVTTIRLSDVRSARGLTQRDLAELLGVSRTSVSAVENGHVAAWPKFRRNAAQILAVEEDELFPDDHKVGVEVVVVWWSRADRTLLSRLASTLLTGRRDEEQSS